MGVGMGDGREAQSFDDYVDDLSRFMPGDSSWVALRRVDSTNRYAQELASRLQADFDAVDPYLVLGFEQTAGRGREGRSWQSLAGRGAYQTAVWPLESNRDTAVLQTLPLLVGVAAFRAVREQVETATLPERTGLKWPNDLWWGGRKLGGILIEVTAVERSQRAAAMIGVGINHSLNGDQLIDNAISLRQIDGWGGAPLASLSACFWRCLVEALGDLGNITRAVEQYRQVVLHRDGETLEWKLGGTQRQGVYRGIDDQGRLLLESDDGLERIAAGDVIPA